MIISLKIDGSGIVGVETKHIITVQEVKQDGPQSYPICEVTLVNNKRLLVSESYNDLCMKINTSR